MKLLKIFLTVLTFSVLCFSCFKDEETRTSDDEKKELEQYIADSNITINPSWTGLYYIENTAGTGEKPEFMDTVVIKYNATRLDGSYVSSSDDYGSPVTFLLSYTNIIDGVNEAVSNMKVGTKARAIIPSALAYGFQSVNNIKPYTTLVYDIELVEIRRGIEIEPYKTSGLMLNSAANDLQYYIIEQDTTGKKVKSGNNVKVHYTGYFYNGRIFDSSVKKNESEVFSVGYQSIIQGLDEGLLLMREGEKFRFIIPPELAYGPYGYYPVIPPDATLIFDIQVIKIL